MAAGMRNDPYTVFRFLVELDGLVVGGFTEVTGLQAEIETELYQEGGLNGYAHLLLKGAKYNNLVLKRGLTDSEALWKWCVETASGNVKRKNGSIILQDRTGDEAWRWNFVRAVPVRWTGPDFRSDSDTVAFETIELAHYGLSKD